MFIGKSTPNYGEEIDPGVFIHRVDQTDEIYRIGIISFRKRSHHLLNHILKKFNLNFPLKIGV